jgi:hypothetical protein
MSDGSTPQPLTEPTPDRPRFNRHPVLLAISVAVLAAWIGVMWWMVGR